MACSDQISTTELENAKTDAVSLAEFATSRVGGEASGALIDSSTTRLGDTFSTVRGQLSKLGYEVPIAYASGISFTVDDGPKTVEEGGLIYAPLISALPFTTSGTFATDAANFRLIVIAADYAPDYVADYVELAALDVATLVDGQTLTVTDEGIGGQGVLRNVVGHGFLSESGDIVRIDDDWFWQRITTGRTFTTEEKTIYVSPTGDDLTGDGSSLNPFESIQRAVDEIPINVLHRQVIQLMDGVHSAGSGFTNPISGASTVREVRVLVDNKNINGRDMLVIQGNLTNKQLTTINHDDVYSALYVEETNGVVLKNVNIDFSLNVDAAISIFQHRRGDMRLSDISINGNDVNGSHAIIGETGAFIEMAGEIEINNVERGVVSLEAVISFTGSSLSHDGGTATQSRTFECGSEGQIYMFSGALNVSNAQRIIWNKSGYVLCSPSSSVTSNITGFAIDCDSGAEIEARRILTTGGALGVNNKGGYVTINLCNFIDQTTSAVYCQDNGTVIIDDCTLRDTTGTKNIVASDNGNIVVRGDGDIYDGARGIYAKNSKVEIEEQVNISNNKFNIDARESEVRLVGTLANPIACNSFVTNALYLVGCNVFLQHVTIAALAGKTSVIAIGSNIYNGGGVNVDGGYRGFDLSQNATLTADTTTGSDITNVTGEGITARRGSQAYYRASSMDFTGTTTNTVQETTKSAHVTSF